MRIIHFIYDDVKNPWCGGGGAYRALEINRRLPGDCDVTVYSGKFRGSKNGAISDHVKRKHIGSGSSYIISRLTYAIIANFIALFTKADLVVNDFSAFAPVLSFLSHRRSQILIIHHLLGERHKRKFKLFGFIFALIELIAVRSRVPKIIVSNSVAKKVKIRSKCRFKVISNGFDSRLLDIPFSIGEHVLFLGRFDFFMKGIDILLDAFVIVKKEVRKVKYVVAGRASDTDLAEMSKMLKDRNLQSSVSVYTNINDDTRKELLSNALCVVMPSRYEGWGIVAIEAAAAGKLCVGSDIDGLPDAVKVNESGWLVPPENSKALAERIIFLINNPAVRMEKASLCRTWAMNFSWEKIVSEQYSFYRNIITNQG